MYISENLNSMKEFLPFIEQSLISANWEILDSFTEEHTVDGVNYEEAALVFKSPSGFIGSVKELYHFNNINTNIFGLHFNYMSSYDRDLGIYNQYDRHDLIEKEVKVANLKNSKRLLHSFAIRKDRSSVKIFINDYRFVLFVESGNVSKNIYLGHYMRYGLDLDVPMPNILSGGLQDVNNTDKYENKNGVSIYDNKYIKSALGIDYPLDNTQLYTMQNVYSLDGSPLVKPKPISEYFLGEFSGVLEYAGNLNLVQNGDIFEVNGSDYMFINNVLIEK